MSKPTDKDKKPPKKASDITTMAVNISVSERIEAYCKAHGMLKKDYIPRAVEFIENFNVDLTAETLYLEDKQAEKEVAIRQSPSPSGTRRRASQPEITARILF